MSTSTCTCAPEKHGEDPSCPWVRGQMGDEIVGHVRACPLTGGPCPCLPGATAHVYCTFDAEERTSHA